MQHADQVAYLERMLRMVRTNTRDDGPGVSHTPAQQIATARQEKLEKTRKLISQDPVVVALTREFGAQLDIDSIQPED